MSLPEAFYIDAQKLVSQRIGLDGFSVRRNEFEQALAVILRAEGGQAPEEKLTRLAELPETAVEWRLIITALTVGESYFFRDVACVEALERVVLPELISARREMGSRYLRVWSTGCATGEEPYTVAMLLDRLLPDRSEWMVSIMASDLNDKAITYARRGRYRKWSLRATPLWAQARYFRQIGTDEYELDPTIRQMVTFSVLNLMGDQYPSVETGTVGVDLIICRNVLMYFTSQAQCQAAARLRSSLGRGGWLLVSPAEASLDLFRPLSPVNHPGIILFRNAAQSNAVRTKEDPLLSSQLLGPSLEPSQQSAYRAGGQVYSLPTCSTQELDGKAPLKESQPTSLEHVELLANQGQLGEARRLCEQALRRDRLNLDGQMLLGSICEEQGELGAALAAFQRAVYIAPDRITGHIMLGSLLLRQGDQMGGRKSLLTATRLLEPLPGHESVLGSGGLRVDRLLEFIHAVLKRQA